MAQDPSTDADLLHKAGTVLRQGGVNDGAPGPDAAATILGRKGGRARAAKLSPHRRRQIARRAARARWAKEKEANRRGDD